MTPDIILDFWFGSANPTVDVKPRSAWFQKNPEFDAEIAGRFGAAVKAALVGELDHWQSSPAGALALILLTDQFTRNIWRDTARAFIGDPIALATASRLVDSGEDRQLGGVQRSFVYLPFEHAESLPEQNRSLQLYRSLAEDFPGQAASASALDYAERHQQIIARFGRFPHRNKQLGRTTTPAEAEFLTTPGSGF